MKLRPDLPVAVTAPACAARHFPGGHRIAFGDASPRWRGGAPWTGDGPLALPMTRSTLARRRAESGPIRPTALFRRATRSRDFAAWALGLLVLWSLPPVRGAAGAAPPVVVIEGGSAFDSAAGRMEPFAAMVIEGEYIRTIVPPGAAYVVPPGAQVVDARGRFVIPGLIDGHVHLVHILRTLQLTADTLFPLFLAQGVTTLRDVGDEVVAEKRLQAAAAAQPAAAPRIIMGSLLVDGNPPYHAFISRPITDPAKVPAFVDEMAGWDVQTYKIYAGASRPVGQALIREAHRRGKWVTAHLAWDYRPQDAAADGIDSLEHVGALLEFVLPPETPRWPPPAERAGRPATELAALERRILEIKANVDLTDPRVTALVTALVENKVAVNPTLVVYRNWMLLRDLPEVRQHPDLLAVPAQLREGWNRSADAQPPDPSTLDLRRRQFAKLQELTGRLYRAGVELLAGTDTPVQFCPPGGAMHQELELLTASGLPPAAALLAATRNNARAIGLSHQLGTIGPGMLADLVILDADPLVDIRNTRRIHRVLHAGLVVDPAVLAVPAAIP